MKAFLTGKPGTGKTTACSKITGMLREEGITCEGVLSREIKARGTRTGFEFVNLGSNVAFKLASIRGNGPVVGKYHVDLDGIKNAAEILKNATGDVIFIDELGPMEMMSRAFIETVDNLLASDAHVVLVVHWKIASRYDCTEITVANRDAVPKEIAARFKDAVKNITRR